MLSCSLSCTSTGGDSSQGFLTFSSSLIWRFSWFQCKWDTLWKSHICTMFSKCVVTWAKPAHAHFILNYARTGSKLDGHCVRKSRQHDLCQKIAKKFTNPLPHFGEIHFGPKPDSCHLFGCFPEFSHNTIQWGFPDCHTNVLHQPSQVWCLILDYCLNGD